MQGHHFVGGNLRGEMNWKLVDFASVGRRGIHRRVPDVHHGMSEAAAFELSGVSYPVVEIKCSCVFDGAIFVTWGVPGLQ